jgi:hypothetical protein
MACDSDDDGASAAVGSPRFTTRGKKSTSSCPAPTLSGSACASRISNFVERQPRKPKEPEKPKIDVEEVREHIAAVHHSIIEHINGEIAHPDEILKSKGVSSSSAGSLDEFYKTTEAGWKDVVEAIDKALEEE